MASSELTNVNPIAPRRQFLARSLGILGAGLIGNVPSTACRANDNCMACADELWLISSRHLGACPPQVWPDCLEYQRCDSAVWNRSSFDDFRAAHHGAHQTVVYVHGNRSNMVTAMSDGMTVYRAIRNCCALTTPLRFVIWAWPSDKVCGLYHDVRVKAARTERQSLLFASLLAHASGRGPLMLLGYSYGARLVAGSLHLLAGGNFCGESLSSCGVLASSDAAAGCDLSRHAVQSVWWAGAFPNRWILPGHHYGMAMQAASHVQVMVNRHDPVLRRYKRALHERDGHAIGYMGVPFARQLGCHAQRLSTCDVTHAVGNRHDWTRYANNPQIMATTCNACRRGTCEHHEAHEEHEVWRSETALK